MNFSHPYLTNQIIAYIGNKRKLLSLLHEALCTIYKESPKQNGSWANGLKFLDLFAGSGVVARFAKYLNFEVFVNDWEEYSYIINQGYLGINQSELNDLFNEEGGLEVVLDQLNSLPAPELDEQFITKYYAPAEFDISLANYKKERLFYTRANALAIDKIRNKIEKLYPPAARQTDKQKKARNLLLAMLLYQAATHTNTSGVFKACHKGFGGHNGDALTRILRPIFLQPPVLIDSSEGVHIFKEDANRLVRETISHKGDIDLVYLDPPYNQHQYGSNYHMLNTIALWDNPPISMALNSQGCLVEKAAIRKDWVKTRSPYCYPQEAQKAFSELVANLKARHILISYSTEGIIPFGRLKEICEKKGKLSLVSSDYVKYRGGKQSNNRLNKNIEFVFIIDTHQPSSFNHSEYLDKLLEIKKLSLLFEKFFVKERLLQVFQQTTDGQGLSTVLNGREIVMYTKDFFRLDKPLHIEDLNLPALKELIRRLEEAICIDKAEELAEIMKRVSFDTVDTPAFIKLIPSLFKKLAHKKYKLLYYYWYDYIQRWGARFPARYSLIQKKIQDIHTIAEKRFTN